MLTSPEWTSSLPSPWIRKPLTFSKVWPVQTTMGTPALFIVFSAWAAPIAEALAAADPANAARYRAVFDQRIPQGGTALVLPVVRLGSGAVWPVGDGHELTVGLDVDVAVDGQRAFVPNIGDVSFHPRLGAAFRYADVVELRGGLRRFQIGDQIGVDLTPSVGAGLDLEQVSIDFSFGDFAGLVAQDLGYSYRISAQLRLEQPGLERPEE